MESTSWDEHKVISKSDLDVKPVILRSILQRNDLEHILSKLSDSYDLKQNHYIPYRFPDIDWNHFERYSSQTLQFLDVYADILVNNVIMRVNQRLSDFSIDTINSSSKHIMNPMTIRVMQPGKVDIHHHCENEGISRFRTFYDHLEEAIDIRDELSMVVMLQQPDEGGEIIVFDELWKDDSLAQGQRSLLEEKDRSGRKDHIKHVVQLNAGDVVIFQAGKTWHRVGEVKGSTARITAGCFLGVSKNDPDKYLAWS